MVFIEQKVPQKRLQRLNFECGENCFASELKEIISHKDLEMLISLLEQF